MTNAESPRLDITALGWALTAALIVLFVISMIVALFFPGLGASHAWIGLFSSAPLDSSRVWIDGILLSAVFGWVTAVILGTVYNRFVAD